MDYEAVQEPRANPSRSLSFTDRAKISFANADPESQVRAIRGLGEGYDARVRDGKVYAIKDGEEFPADSEDLELADIADWAGEVPEMVGQTIGGSLGTVGATPGAGTFIGMGVGGAAGRKARQEIAQAMGVEDADREGQWGEVLTSGVIGAAVPKVLDKSLPAIKTMGSGIATTVKQAMPAIPRAGAAIKRVPATIADAVIGVSPGRTAQIMGPEGRTIAKNAANIDEFAERAIPKAKEVADEVKSAIFDQYRRDTQNVIPRDALADTSGIAARLDQKISELQLIDPKKAATGPRIDALKSGKLRGIQSDTDAREILAYRDALDQVQTIDDALTLRANLDDAIDWANGPAQIGKKAQGVLKTLRADVEKYIESAADVAGTGQQYRAAKEAYQRNVNTHGKLAKAFSDERVLSSLRNLDGAAKTQLRKAMRDAKELVPSMADDIAELENYAAATEWTNFIKPIDVGRGLAGIGGGAVAAGAVNPVVGGLGYIATRPAVARQYLPQIGATGRTIARSTAGATRAAGRSITPAIPTLQATAARGAVERLRPSAPITGQNEPNQRQADPRELMGDKWANAQSAITTAYGRDVRALIDAGESPEDATAQVLRALAQKHRYNAKNLPGTFAGVVKQVQAAAKEQYGQDITRAQAIELLAGAQ